MGRAHQPHPVISGHLPALEGFLLSVSHVLHSQAKQVIYNINKYILEDLTILQTQLVAPESTRYAGLAIVWEHLSTFGPLIPGICKPPHHNKVLFHWRGLPQYIALITIVYLHIHLICTDHLYYLAIRERSLN